MFAIALMLALVSGLGAMTAFLINAWGWLVFLSLACVGGFAICFRQAYGESQH